ncbi:hypothetical protein ECDEC8C_1867 [Escherichia coli DEC8C]|nr:hypothetical protein ECDEC8C_1867 [Escherichia coli DEC8C]
MTFKHYDVVRAASPSDLAEKLTHKLKEGWQPFGRPKKTNKISVIREIAEKLIKFNTKKNQGIRKLLIASIPSLFARNFSGLSTC